ncbi:MAG: UDP-N-acetylmuramate dehydrogenase [Patescibacteria group bacterium]|nr:UDP-N-acetylmuramate dehydrogenase [Patescibacteria group bacterium]
MRASDPSKIGKKAGLLIEEKKPLAPLTNWRIGGPARWFIEATNAETVAAAIKLAGGFKIPVFILGGGTNILVSDKGFPGLVIKIATSSITREQDIVWADAGVAMGRLAVFCLDQNLAGMEWAVGLPGTVGGAVCGNSNCFGSSTAEIFLRAETLDKHGRIHTREKDYFRFDYDHSRLQETGEVLLRAAFKLKAVPPEVIAAIREQVQKNTKQRIDQQPQGTGTAGSTFKAIKPTPENAQQLSAVCPDWEKGLRDGFVSAGFIIDKCLGLKGFELSGMRISVKHANFFVNLGHARAAGAKQLIDFVKKSCEDKLHIKLEEEIKYVGDFSKINHDK